MEQIFLTSQDKYFLHQVDRWPVLESYGGDYIFLHGKHNPVTEYDHEMKIVYCQHITVHLNNIEQDHALFLEIMGRPWDETYKGQYVGDENYTDYSPGFYSTLEDFHNKKLTLYNLR